MSLNELIAQARKAWHGVRLGQPDWGAHSHSVALTAELRRERLLVHIILNAYHEPLAFELPPPGADNGSGCWHRWIDTALDSPSDIVDWNVAPALPELTYAATNRSVVVLFARLACAGDHHPFTSSPQTRRQSL